MMKDKIATATDLSMPAVLKQLFMIGMKPIPGRSEREDGRRLFPVCFSTFEGSAS